MSEAQRAPFPTAVAFPSSEDHVAFESTPAPLILPRRGLPVHIHTRSRSLFDRKRPNLPQFEKKPEPSSFKPTRQPATSAAAESRVAAMKASLTVKSDATVEPTTSSTKADVATAAKGPVEAAVPGPSKPVTEKPAALSATTPTLHLTRQMEQPTPISLGEESENVALI
ncbi:hypothetical protein BDZ89DRAFT_1134763 [Hymenopellis radicata]|nr:hypothetical protein BDZ89DRAFT_1134763 [Hymenopellis radicata]